MRYNASFYPTKKAERMQDFIIERFRKVNDPKDTKGTREEYKTFKQLASQFMDCRKLSNKLHGGGWVRGKLEGSVRKKENIVDTKLMVIDGDKSIRSEYSACEAKHLHDALLGLELNHVIYSSFSNDPENNIHRWRCVLPCDKSMQADEVAINTEKFVKMLQDQGLDVKNASENKNMCQMWFYPASKDPEKCFEFYEYHKGGEYEVDVIPNYDNEPDTKRRSEPLATKPDIIAERRSNDELIRLVMTGEELHEPLRNLSFQMMQDGMSKYWTEKHLDVMLSTLEQDDRVKQRRIDLPRMIHSVSVEASDYKTNFTFESVDFMQIAQPPKAPGLMGEFIKEAMESQTYTNSAVATATCLGLVAGITGRTYLAPIAKPIGLNEYFLVSMQTGGGKDFIQSFIKDTLRQSATINTMDYKKFIGAQAFTGGKALRQMLSNKSCCVSVLSEMGKMLQSQAGDQASLRRAILQLYSTTGENDFLTDEVYSKEEDNQMQLDRPAFTAVGEAEPSGFITTLNDTNSLRDGLLPRSIVFRADCRRPYESDNVRSELSQQIRERVSDMMAQAEMSSKGGVLVRMKVDKEVKKLIRQHSNYWTDVMNDTNGKDHQANCMSTRVHIHSVKIACLSAIMNSENLADVTLGHEDWEFGRDVAAYSFESIASFMDNSSSGSGSLADTMQFVGGRLQGLFEGYYQGKQYDLDKYCKAKTNTLSDQVFRKLFARTPEVKKLEMKGYKNNLGCDVLVEYMIDKKFMIESHNRGKRYYSCTNKILEVF